MDYEIKDLKLAKTGKLKIDWASMWMPVLTKIRQRFEKEKPLQGVKIAACLHVTSETACLVRTLKAGGARIYLCASNPLSTQDDVAASIVKDYKISVFAQRGESEKLYYQHINTCIDFSPIITLDDGADLVSSLHTSRKDKAEKIIGGTEETTTGISRLKAMSERKVLLYPIIAVNDANTKHLFDNRYGTGQSTLDGLLRATNILLAGKTVVISGYGWCGRGIALRAKGMGAQVIITEIEPLRALEALMDGYQVLSLAEAAPRGDVFITATGGLNILRKEHFQRMKDGAILANAGHFNVEIDLQALSRLSTYRRQIRPSVEEFKLKNGNRIYLLGEGRLLNLVAAEGHPAAVMDMSFANQALSVEYLVKTKGKLIPKVYKVPLEIDKEVASLKLETMGVKIDALTPEQRAYLSSWEEGT